MNILAQQVNIEAAKEQSTSDYKHEMQQKGLTLAVNVPVVSAVQSVAESAKQVGQSKNDRVNAMAAANAGFDAYKAGQALSSLQGALSNAGSLNGGVEVGVSLTYGEQKILKQAIHKVPRRVKVRSMLAERQPLLPQVQGINRILILLVQTYWGNKVHAWLPTTMSILKQPNRTILKKVK